MTENDILYSFGVRDEGTSDESNFYTVTLSNVDEFSKVHSLLNKSDVVEVEESEVTMDGTEITYVYGDNEYFIVLAADFNKDEAEISIRKL